MYESQAKTASMIVFIVSFFVSWHVKGVGSICLSRVNRDAVPWFLLSSEMWDVVCVKLCVIAFLVRPQYPPPLPHTTRQAVADWGRANPSGTRRTRAVGVHETPVLRSTRNALGVLAGGGEADLAGDGSAEVLQ